MMSDEWSIVNFTIDWSFTIDLRSKIDFSH